MPDLKFQFMVDYFGSLSRHIVKKQYVNGEMLAEALRKKESLPFPETLLDYLCRFLENEIKRGRGRPKAPNFKEPHSGNTCHCRLEHVTKRIESGDKVSGSELTDILRSEAVGEIPDRMLEYLCQFLTVSVKKPRGRPPMPPFPVRRIVFGRDGAHNISWCKLEIASYSPLPFPSKVIPSCIAFR